MRKLDFLFSGSSCFNDTSEGVGSGASWRFCSHSIEVPPPQRSSGATVVFWRADESTRFESKMPALPVN